jgi:hypothetical protein
MAAHGRSNGTTWQSAKDWALRALAGATLAAAFGVGLAAGAVALEARERAACLAVTIEEMREDLREIKADVKELLRREGER